MILVTTNVANTRSSWSCVLVVADSVYIIVAVKVVTKVVIVFPISSSLYCEYSSSSRRSNNSSFSVSVKSTVVGYGQKLLLLVSRVMS